MVGKMKMNGLLTTKLVGLLVIICNLIIIPLIVLSIFKFQWLFFVLFFLKLLPDLLVLVTDLFFTKKVNCGNILCHVFIISIDTFN